MNAAKPLAGQTIFITGANVGIGRATALALAEQGATMVLAGRSRDRTQPVLDELGRISGHGEALFLPMDLADLESVATCADTFLARGEPLTMLINNAGLAGQRGITKQGFELAFGTNHLGHFLLTQKLLPLLQQAPAARIVNVSSGSHFQPKRFDWSTVRRTTASTTGLPEYGISKLCNVLHAKELARGKAGPTIVSASLHPGVVASDVWRSVPWPFRGLMKVFMISNEEGAKTSIHCATAKDIVDGAYYDKCREKRPSALARDEALSKELWQKSEEWVAPFLKS